MEVLISILIMGIGLVTLATLFPIAVLRTIQATQATNATILRLNAEALIDADPTDPNPRDDPYSDLVADPDGNDQPNIGQNYIVDPLGWNLVNPNMQNTPNPTLERWFGNSGGTPVQAIRRYSGNPSAFRPRIIVQQMFGVQWQNASPGQKQQAMQIAQNNADRLVRLPDSWITQYDDTPLSQSPGPPGPPGTRQVTMPANFDGSSVTPGSRVVLFNSNSVNGRSGEVRPIANIPVTGPTVQWNQAVNFPIERVRIETPERRYTWLLTVRSTGVNFAVDVVVFFRRSFSPLDEQVWGSPQTPMFDPQNGNQVQVNNPTTNGPFLDEGEYILDVANARWYRIQDIQDANADPAVLTLERPIQERGDAGAILMRGIVKVFHIGNK